MIDARDLRIGNLFLDASETDYVKADIVKIDSIRSDGECSIIYKDSSIDYGVIDFMIKPIKLTEKILLQCGATNCNYGIFEIEHMTVNVPHKLFFCGDQEITCEYLHDLQNLYYYHNSKQELPINIETLEI